MDRAIDDELRNAKFNSQDELKSFIRKIQSKIALYEKRSYLNESYTEKTASKIQVWRNKIQKIINSNREIEETENDDKAGLHILKLLNKQISISDTNQNILEKSTLKLLGLNYSIADIEKIIQETGKRFEQGINIENSEIRNIKIALCIFVFVCLGIIIDKFRLKICK